MGHSIWESTAFHAQPSLTVIGAGIVGLWSAIHYKRRFPHHHVLVLERGGHPSGASVRNAGFACFGSPSELLADSAKEGRDAALRRVEERWLGLLEMRAELGDEAIGFEETGGHELYDAHSALYNRVAEGFDRLNKDLAPIFRKPPFSWANERIGSFGISGLTRMSRTDLEGPIDSGRMMFALLAKAAASRVLVRPHSVVTGLEEHTDHIRIRLLDGNHIRSDRVLLATNGFTPALMPQLDVVPARGQVLLTEPIPGLRLRGTFHMEEGFYYFRDLHGGILIGGGRHLDITGETTAEEGTSPLIQSALERVMKNHLLKDTAYSIKSRWSGTMAFGSQSKEPLVQRVSERIGVAVRLSGMGVAIGIRVARRAAELMAD
jgi:gamma-glutamylputrescine oxidase